MLFCVFGNGDSVFSEHRDFVYHALREAEFEEARGYGAVSAEESNAKMTEIFKLWNLEYV